MAARKHPYTARMLYSPQLVLEACAKHPLRFDVRMRKPPAQMAADQGTVTIDIRLRTT